MGDAAWIDAAEVSASFCNRMRIRDGDAIHLSLAADDGRHSELTSCVLLVVPTGTSSQDNSNVFVHPLLYDLLSQASELLSSKAIIGSAADQDDCAVVSIGPLRFCSPMESSLVKNRWLLRKLQTKKLPDGSKVSLKCLYVESKTSPSTDDEEFFRALEGRVIMKGTTIAFFTLNSYVIAIVSDLKLQGQYLDRDVGYRVGEAGAFVLEVSIQDGSAIGSVNDVANHWEDTCPGYESILEDLIHLLQFQGGASPSGILLTGCTGVGKTRLAASAAGRLKRQGWSIHWISIQDLLLRASFATEEDMIDALTLPRDYYNAALILDDLNALAHDGSEESATLDSEQRLVRNSIIQAIDNSVQSRVSILGIGQSTSNLPSEVVKTGLLEKEITMASPTQHQRELILSQFLQQAGVDGSLCEKWTEVLAPVTAGCVAADLCRLCKDAWTRALARTGDESVLPSWDDLREAAQHCLPSQLAALDVIKPPSYVEECSLDDWSGIHELGWSSFAGYDDVKRLIFRTVVVPWRRQLCIKTAETGTTASFIAPPSGVLFHGSSGCGKTLAASCLGASLGLSMIKVRAADVLDKWLGGSEAAIRSLFDRARGASPCVLFFDEIDAVASNRADEGDSTGVMSRLMSTLLNEMDGVSSGVQPRILVVACTNRLEALDAALLRPGRLEEIIYLPKPSIADATKILRSNLANAPLGDDVSLDAVAGVLTSKQASGAEVEGIAREAVLRSLRQETDPGNVNVTIADFRAAMRALKLE